MVKKTTGCSQPWGLLSVNRASHLHSLELFLLNMMRVGVQVCMHAKIHSDTALCFGNLKMAHAELKVQKVAGHATLCENGTSCRADLHVTSTQRGCVCARTRRKKCLPSESFVRCWCFVVTPRLEVTEPPEGVAIALLRCPMRIQKYLLIGEEGRGCSPRTGKTSCYCVCVCVWQTVCQRVW